MQKTSKSREIYLVCLLAEKWSRKSLSKPQSEDTLYHELPEVLFVCQRWPLQPLPVCRHFLLDDGGSEC